MSWAKRNVTFVDSLENPSVHGQFKRYCPLFLSSVSVACRSLFHPDLDTALNMGAMVTVNPPAHTVCVRECCPSHPHVSQRTLGASWLQSLPVLMRTGNGETRHRASAALLGPAANQQPCLLLRK